MAKAGSDGGLFIYIAVMKKASQVYEGIYIAVIHSLTHIITNIFHSEG